MFTPARKAMPAIDYVSLIKSLYKDRLAMVLGALAAVIGAFVTAYKTDSPILWGIAIGFVLVTVYRYIDMTMYLKADFGPTDVDTAAHWELRATFGGALFAALCGVWCFACLVAVDSPICELISMVITIACMVGIVTRNFGLDRLLTIQLVLALSLICVGLFLKGGGYHWFLAVVMIPMLVSFRSLAADVRGIMLAAVHGRVDASRLAAELDTALETMQHGLCMLDENGVIAVSNARAEQVFTKLVPGNWIGQRFETLISDAREAGNIPPQSADRLMDTVADDSGGKVVLRFADGEYCEVTVSSRQHRTVLLFEDITERVKAEERINFMAHYDALTGLPNRAYFTQRVEADLERRRHTRSDDLAMLMVIDIDDFKHVNDTMGHLIGDRVLVETAERMRKALGDGVLLARLGGDEYVAYRSGGVNSADIEHDPNAILGAFKAPFEVAGEVFPVNVSVGVTTTRDAIDDLDDLMTKSDLALYKAKSNGKSQAQVFHAEMDTAYRYRQRLKADLRTAIDEGGLTLVFQPIVDLNSRRVVSCEALARWHHPELGSIPPSLFIPIAEETGMISDISRWVLTTACKECGNWPADVSVSVNISARDFRNSDVTRMVSEALSSSGLTPARLEVEVTETALIEERDTATAILGELAKRGIGIALDDFGTGYSSLSYLHTLPFTKLKVDRSFVMDIVDNPRSLKLLSNVAQLGKDINLTVTAEGVESEEQLRLIAEHSKVDQIQGFLFGVPLPRREIAELIGRMASNEVGRSHVSTAQRRTANVVNIH